MTRKISTNFQIIIITFGFISSGIIIKSSLNDWSDSPLLTTLDSIGAPNEDVQFPTVTACKDESKPLSNWHLIETILNEIEFQCNDQDCLKSQLHKDFQPILDGYVWNLKNWLFNPQTSHFAKTILGPCTDDYEYEDWREAQIRKNCENVKLASWHITVEKVAHLLSNKSISFNQVKSLHESSIGFVGNVKDFIEDKGIHIYDGDYDLFNDNEPIFGDDLCNTTKCQKQLHTVGVWLDVLANLINVQPKLSFGSYVSNFVHLLEYNWSFRRNQRLNSLNAVTSCDMMTKDETKMQQYFARLSEGVGFSENESVSLYDVPSMIANVPYDNMAFGKLFVNQAFLHTRCQINEKAYWATDTRDSLKAWKDFSDDPISTCILLNIYSYYLYMFCYDSR